MEQGLPSLPNGWYKKQLGDVVKLSQGTQVPVGDQYLEQEDGLIRFLRISDFVRSDEPPRYILNPGSQYLVEADDICMIRYGDAGRAVTGLAGALANNLFKISPIESLLKRFLFLQLCSPRCVDYLRAANNSSTMPAISFKAVNAMEVSVAPLDEQKRIVEKLDALLTRIDTAIEHLQESVTLKNSLLQSALDGQFSAINERMTIESLAEVKGGKRLPKGEKLSDEETEHPYIRVADFTDKGTIDLSGIKYISKEIHEQIKRYVISKDDLYISIAGTIGKTGFLPPELDGANLTENAAKLVIRDKQQLDLSYLYLFTLTSDFSAQAGLATKTVAQPKLALTRLSKIEIPMCSLEEQKSLVSTIEALKSKIHDAEAVLLGKIEDLKSLKASILDSAFKGEL